MRTIRFAAILVVTAFISACGPKHDIMKEPISQATEKTKAAAKPVAETAAPPITSGELIEAAAPEADIRGGDFTPAQDLQNVQFDFDKYDITDAAKNIIEKNAVTLKGRPDTEALVEGHCDERGTIEYNLALGQKRAKEVRDYYIRLGIAVDRITTISYGKEKPLCQESNENCWAKNRRAETKLRPKTAATANAE